LPPIGAGQTLDVKRWLASLSLLAAVAVPASAGAQAVTYQSGPTHDGNAAKAGLRPPLSRTWTARVDGVPSYPVIAEGRVYVTVALRDFSTPPRTVLLALSARDGHRLWRVELGRVWSASPAYDAGRVFVAADDTGDEGGGLSAYSAATGARLWRTEAGSSAGDPPVAVDGVVYALMGSTWIAAHRQSDGAEVWEHVPGNGTDGSVAVTDDSVYAALPCEDTRRLRRSDGALIWATPHECHGGGGTTAVFAGGRLFTRDAARGDRIARWRSDYPPAIAGSLGLFPDASRRREHWVFGHRLVARSLPSGRVRWRFAGDGYLDTAPLIAGRLAYVGSGSGRVFGVSLRTGRAVWRASLGVPVHGSAEFTGATGGLAAAGGLLVVPAFGRVAAFR
jgi:outer membrane protein assembly factor BamB